MGIPPAGGWGPLTSDHLPTVWLTALLAITAVVMALDLIVAVAP